jgi:hypothetical protein
LYLSPKEILHHLSSAQITCSLYQILSPLALDARGEEVLESLDAAKGKFFILPSETQAHAAPEASEVIPVEGS